MLGFSVNCLTDVRPMACTSHGPALTSHAGQLLSDQQQIACDSRRVYVAMPGMDSVALCRVHEGRGDWPATEAVRVLLVMCATRGRPSLSQGI